MGMDLTTYRLIRPVNEEYLENEEDEVSDRLRVLYFDEAQAEFIRSRFPEVKLEPDEYVDMPALQEAFEVPAGCSLEEWDLTGAQGVVKFRAENGALLDFHIDDTSRFLRKTERVAASFLLEHMGYIRKPFRKDDSKPTARAEGDTFILRSDNFDGADKSLKALLNQDDCNMTLLSQDMALCQQLQKHAFDAKLWQTEVTQWLAKGQESDAVYAAVLDW